MPQNRRILLIFTILITTFSLFIPTCRAQTIGSDISIDLQAVDAFLQGQVKANRIPGVAVAIMKDGQIVFLKGYGESAPGRPVTGQTQFYIGSVSKSFTALAVMQLVQEGKLDLDAPVQKYLPWFEVADPAASKTITVRHLLYHTSGLSEKGDPNVSVVADSLEEQARLLKQVHPTATPGAIFQYYNPNYRLLGLLVEKISGRTFEEYLTENILAPLGMDRTVTRPSLAEDLSQGYGRLFGFPLARSQEFNPSAVPSGYLISTAEDMGRYLIAHLDNAYPDGTPLLQPASLAEMRTPPAGGDSELGMGWLVAEGGNTLAYGGALEYFQAFVVMGLKERTGLVILYNQNSIENMFLENNIIRDGLLAILNGKTPSTASFGWVGWLFLTLACADLLNHARLFRMLPVWLQKTAGQRRVWLWLKVGASFIFPLFIFLGLPLLVRVTQGGAPDWIQPFRLVPDLAGWLLVGLGLNFIRSLLHAAALLHASKYRPAAAVD